MHPMLDRRTALLAIGSLPVVPTFAATSRVVSQGTIDLRLCLDVKNVSIGYFTTIIESKIKDFNKTFFPITSWKRGIHPKGIDRTWFMYIGSNCKLYQLTPCTPEESNVKICGNKYLESLYFKTDEDITAPRAIRNA
jgi:hypothetical protein